ncbi:hypothetical protein GF312_08655 [Candidatus Poribacteria bacterium]|nr:hypothetical protein [Candidatus Poribacteria bacterium]
MIEPYEEIIPEDINPEERNRILKKFAEEVVSRRLTAPAIFMLETCSPLSFIGSQVMIILDPLIRSIFNIPDYRKFALIIERRENIEILIKYIEELNNNYKLSDNNQRNSMIKK